MTAPLHELLTEMFRVRPALAPELLQASLNAELPPFDAAHLASAASGEALPAEAVPARSGPDVAITLTHGDETVLAVAVEVQLRQDPQRRLTWPAQTVDLHVRFGCPVFLLVLCRDQSVADWAAEPITVGPPGFVLTPQVVGPGRMPVISDRRAAEQVPELVVLSVLANARRTVAEPLLTALLHALNRLDTVHRRLYTDLLLSSLPPAASAWLKDVMITRTREAVSAEQTQDPGWLFTA